MKISACPSMESRIVIMNVRTIPKESQSFPRNSFVDMLVKSARDVRVAAIASSIPMNRPIDGKYIFKTSTDRKNKYYL